LATASVLASSCTHANAHNADYALFFEFKHFKEKKNKLSTRCFSFMEYDEIKSGRPIALEL
jgi:hypothetical protein